MGQSVSSNNSEKVPNGDIDISLVRKGPKGIIDKQHYKKDNTVAAAAAAANPNEAAANKKEGNKMTMSPKQKPTAIAGLKMTEDRGGGCCQCDPTPHHEEACQALLP